MSSNRNKVYLWVEPVSLEEASFESIIDHTSICVELDNDLKYVFSYNEHGLSSSPIANIPNLKENISLGDTSKTLPEIMEQAQKLLEGRFKEYSLLFTNCNHFCNELSKYLCGKPIPSKYTDQAMINVAAGAVLIGGGIAIGSAVAGVVGSIGGAVAGFLLRR